MRATHLRNYGPLLVKFLAIGRRARPCRILVGLAALLLLVRFGCQLLPGACFVPDESLEPQLMQHILSRFRLPGYSLPAVGATRTVQRVHFMYRSRWISPIYRQYLASWRRTYPSYELYFWTDIDLTTLMSQRYPQLVGFYKYQLKNALERSDFARILVLHAFGGWYADLDAGSQVSAEALTERHALIVPLEPYTHAMVAFNRRRMVNNGVMYSAVGHPYWLFYVERIVSEVESLAPGPRNTDLAVHTTGPVMMTRTMDLFAMAHSQRCGDASDRSGREFVDFWCPNVPEPRLFLPLVDNSTKWVRIWASILCLTVFNQPGITEECNRLGATGYANELPQDAYTYHAFLHMNYDKKKFNSPSTAAGGGGGGGGSDQSAEDVSSWGLDIRLNPLTRLP